MCLINYYASHFLCVFQCTHGGTFSAACCTTPSLACNYAFPIDLPPKEILFDAKLIGKLNGDYNF